MTYIPYLETFFFSRYPSVALARNKRYVLIGFIVLSILYMTALDS